MFEIIGLRPEQLPDDIDGVYEDLRAAKVDLDYLRKLHPEIPFSITKDGVKLTDSELVAELRNFDIDTVMESQSRLPSTYRRGGGHERDDVAIGKDGQPTKVWGPDNPEDRHD